jgi:hypothetical protein
MRSKYILKPKDLAKYKGKTLKEHYKFFYLYKGVF